MRSLLFDLAQAFGIVLLADFVAGVVHWLEDAYGSEDTPVLGPLVIKPNIVHHHFPRYFTKLSWWQSSWQLALLSALVLAAAWCWGVLSWQLWLFVLVSLNANQVHKWSHRTRAENGPLISFLQDIRVLQTPRQHALHHTDPKNTYYCPVTNVLNPLLEKLQFWTRAEALIARATGIRHRHDTSNRGQGPAPAWLEEFRPAKARAQASVSPAVLGVTMTETPAPAPAARLNVAAARCACGDCPARRGGHCTKRPQSVAA